MKHNQNTVAAIKLHRAIRINSEKNWPLLRGNYGVWGRTLVAVAVVERWLL